MCTFVHFQRFSTVAVRMCLCFFCHKTVSLIFVDLLLILVFVWKQAVSSPVVTRDETNIYGLTTNDKTLWKLISVKDTEGYPALTNMSNFTLDTKVGHVAKVATRKGVLPSRVPACECENVILTFCLLALFLVGETTELATLTLRHLAMFLTDSFPKQAAKPNTS